MTVLGIDHGIEYLGWALCDESTCKLVDLGVIVAHRNADAGIMLDRGQRSTTLARLVSDKAAGCSVVVIEQMSLPPGGKSSALAIGLAWGAVAGMAAAQRPAPRLLTVSPQRWQLEIFGRKSSYEEIEPAAVAHIREHHPKAAAALERIPERHRNHAIDAAMMALMAALRADKLDDLEAVETVQLGAACLHGNRYSVTCSQCRGVKPRRVTERDGMVLVDGVPTRPVDPGMSPRARAYTQRGGRATSRKLAK